jgi:hypothetical protein
MKSHLILVFILLLLISTISNAQDCDCESNFNWLKKTFEENDAGFQYILDSKGTRAYSIHNELSLEKIKSAKTSAECTKAMKEWLAFFRSGHIGIELIKSEEINNQSANIQQASTVNNRETINIDVEKFIEYLDRKEETDFEGIWEMNLYKIGIRKEGKDYIGFIIESGVEEWKKGDLKLKIIPDEKNLKSICYLRNHSVLEENNAVKLIGTNYLKVGQYFWFKRLQPKLPIEPSVESYLKLTSTQSPYMEEIDENTLLFRIPSFGWSAKNDIDSVIFSNVDNILTTENLIIDLRYNPGGNDPSFWNLIPILYTNPIRTFGIEYLSTKQNNQMWLRSANDTTSLYHDENYRKWAKDVYDKLERHLGEFMNVNPTVVNVLTEDTVYMYPKNIGIIINEGCGSTTEGFLYQAKQSKKVKLFGTNTWGAFDTSNMWSAESPGKEFRLWYCLSRSLSIPDISFDNKGFQPDYYIDKTIPQWEWVNFVKEILNK